MEEAKAAAYYDELNRKGEGARRFKQGLGFSSSSPSFPSKPSSSSSLLSGFVRAGATASAPQPSSLAKPTSPEPPRSHRRSCSRSPPRPRRRSRSRSRSPSRRRRSWSRSRERRDRRDLRRRSRSRSRSRSPSRRSGRGSHSDGPRDRHGDRGRDGGGRASSKGQSGRGGGKMDYSRLIEGYDKMTPAEKVKAKMKLQLSETASKDTTLRTATVGWERFDFDKDAPLDEDDADMEVANDDASLVKHIGKSFRLSAVESKHEDRVRAAHDEAIFGVPTSLVTETETAEGGLKTNDEGEKPEYVEVQASSSLVNDKVLGMQKGSWRERAQKLRQDSNT